MKALIFSLIFVFLIPLSFAGGIESSVPIIKVSVEPGGQISYPVNLIFSESDNFKVSYSSENDFIYLGRDTFSVSSGESVNLNILLDSKDIPPGVYTGKIIISGEKSYLEIPVILGVETSFPFFGVTSEVPAGFSSVNPGQPFSADVNVYNLKNKNNKVSLYYSLKDFDGNIFYSDSQIIDVENNVKLTKEILIPEGLSGQFVFSVVASDSLKLSTDTSAVVVSVSDAELSPGPKDEKNNYLLFGSFFFVFVLIGAFLIFNYYWNKRVLETARNWNRKLVDVKKIKFGDASRGIRSLERKKQILETALSKGYISRTSFANANRKINELMKGLKKRL